MWIFTVDHSGQFNLAFEMFGSAIILRNTSRNGFRDFATSSSMGAYEQYIAVYRWLAPNTNRRIVTRRLRIQRIHQARP